MIKSAFPLRISAREPENSAMVPEVVHRNFMACCLAKVGANVRDVEIRTANEPQIVCDGERPDIKKDVVRRAQT
jgi:hypothetical protein